MPEKTVGLLSGNKELIKDFTDNIQGLDIKVYKSFDAIKPDEFDYLSVDIEFFESAEVIQFFLSRIRKKIHGKPVMLILRVNSVDELNFDWFFDEFILYPFRKGELISRFKKLAWEGGTIEDENILVIGNLKIYLKEYMIYLNDEKLDFTYKEFELLRYMVENSGVVFSRKELLNKIWGVEYIGGTRTVDVHIRRLRSKLGEEFNSIIETVRNVGYRCKAAGSSNNM